MACSPPEPGNTHHTSRPGLGHIVVFWCGHSSVAHPELVCCPIGFLTTGVFCGRGYCAAEQRPLGTVVAPVFTPQIGRQIPPFDAKTRMGAVVVGEAEPVLPGWYIESLGLGAQTAIALRLRWQGRQADQQTQNCYPTQFNVHGQTPSPGQLGLLW